MSSKKKSITKQFQQNKTNRVVKNEKRFEKTQRSKSDEAYIGGDYRSSVSKRSYGIKKALSEGKEVTGYGADYIDTKGMSRSNYNKLQKGENPYEAKYLYTGKPTQIKTKDGNTFTSRNRYLTKEEKDSYNNTGELYHKNYRKNKSYLDMDTYEGGKFEDRLKTFGKNGMKLDGLETAIYNQKDGKHINNIVNLGVGLAKDFVGDPIVDLLKGFDRVESGVTNGVFGAVEQAGNVIGGKGWQDGLIKDVVNHSIKESDETGWGTSSADNWRNIAKRNNYELDSMQNTALGILGFGVDVLNPIDIGGKVVGVGKGLLKGAKGALNGVESATDVMRVAPGFKAGKSDDVFFAGKKVEETAETARMNKSYKNAVDKPEVTTGKPKLDNFLKNFEGFPNKVDKVGEQRSIDGRTLNKKRTQTKDGYVPRVIDDVVEVSQKSDASLEQLDMFGQLKNHMYETPKSVAKYETSNISELNLPQRKEAMMKFLGDKNVLNAPVENINSLKKIASRIKPKGANSKEIVEFLNKQMFNGDNVIVGSVNNKTLKQFLENEVSHLENSRKLRNTTNPVERTKLNLALNDTGNKRNQFISQLTDENLFDKQQYIKSKYGNSPSGFKKAINDNLEYIKKLQKGEVKLPDGSPYPNVNKEVDRLVAQNNEYNKLLKQATNERNSIGDLPDNKWIEFRSKNANKNNRVGLDDNAKRIDTNIQETFENASMQTTNADNRELTNQKWQIAQRMNGNKSVGYFNKIVDNETKNLDIITRDMDDLLYDAMMGDKDASKKLKEYDIERDKIQAKIDNARKTKAKMIKDFNDIGKRLEGELDVNTAIAEMMSEAKSTNPITYKKQKKVTYESLGNSKEASIARKLAEQHGIDEPIAMPTVIPELVRYNKEQIQKLVQLRVMQSFEGNKGKGSMNEAVNMLIKSHMDNMKKSMPNDYDKLVEGVGKYKDDLRKAYMSYKNAKGSVTTTPLNKIGDSFYKKATKEADDVSGVKLKMDLQKLARKFINEDIPQHLETLGEVGKNTSKMNNPFDNVKAVETPIQKFTKRSKEDIEAFKIDEAIRDGRMYVDPETGEIIQRTEKVKKNTPKDEIQEMTPKEKAHIEKQLKKKSVFDELIDDSEHNALSEFGEYKVDESIFKNPINVERTAKEQAMLDRDNAIRQAKRTGKGAKPQAYQDVPQNVNPRTGEIIEPKQKIKPEDIMNKSEKMSKEELEYINKQLNKTSAFDEKLNEIKYPEMSEVAKLRIALNKATRTGEGMKPNASLDKIPNNVNPKTGEIIKPKQTKPIDIKRGSDELSEKELEYINKQLQKKSAFDDITEVKPKKVERTTKEQAMLDRDNEIRKMKRTGEGSVERKKPTQGTNPFTGEIIEDGAKINPMTGEVMKKGEPRVAKKGMSGEDLELKRTKDGRLEWQDNDGNFRGKPTFKDVDNYQKEVEKLAKQGIDTTKQPPKEKPKNMPLNVYKAWLNAWKKGVTVYNPGWHVQNFFQNKGQNYFALGNKAFLPQTDAKNVLKASQGKAFKDVNINGMDAQQLATLAKDLGVMDSFGDDVQMATKGLMSKIDNSKPMKKLQEIEPTARLNHWIRQMENGMTPEKARDSVNKYLYDYSKSSKMDDMIKNIDPFWTFHKNNARMLTQSAIEHPSRMNNIMRAQRGLEGDIPEEQRQAEDSKWREFQDGNKTYTDSEDRQYNYLYDQGMFSDIGDAFPMNENELTGKLNPLLQIALRTAQGQGRFGNELVKSEKGISDGLMEMLYEDAGFGKTASNVAIKDAFLDVNPIAPTLISMFDGINQDKKKVEDEKMSQEIADKRALNDWIQFITGNKGNWYRNLK